MSDEPTFDTAHEPWIPCREPDGKVTELGIFGALGRAHELTGLSGDLPTQTFALTRLLLAVLHATVNGPRDVDGWEALWQAETLPAAAIADYLARHRENFDLLHPRTPFLQVAELHTAKGETSELSKLIADVPNGVPFFATRRGELSLSFAEAARWLVHCHAFDPSGIKSGAVGDDRVKSGKGYPIGVAWSGWLGGVLLEGGTLKETLLLNLVAQDRPGDLPVWERPPLTPADESGFLDSGREPTGPVDLYTWPSRRIRLLAEGGRVTRVLIANGNRLAPHDRHDVEPHTAWRKSANQQKLLGRSTPVYMPRAHDPDRAIWRGLESLLPALSSAQGSDGSDYLSPGVLRWLGELCTEQALADEHPVQVRAIGVVYGSQSSVVTDLVHDTLNLHAHLARANAAEKAILVRDCVHAAEAAALALGNLAGDLVAAAGGDGAEPRSRARERLYSRLDPQFRSWLDTVTRDSDAVDLQTRWHTTARQSTVDAAHELLANISPASWEGREVRGRVLTAAHADKRFWKALDNALPFASVDRPAAAST